jgi:hypothetical protein
MHENKNGKITENFITNSDDEDIFGSFKNRKTSLQL